MELVHLGIKEKDPRRIELKNLSDLLDHLLQYRLQLQGLTSCSRDGMKGGKLVGSPLQLVIELGIVNRYSRLAREQGEKLDLFITKLMFLSG
ncbi:MAG: hypothetical protein O6837_10870, partial [Deltaproteobacteria bacterium]|nr:hypothetical protein [Deltaproteobacteria bacterium]